MNILKKTMPQLALAALLGAASVSAPATTVRIHYDTQAGESIAVRTDQASGKGQAATRGADGVWTFSWPDRLGEIDMQPALNDALPAVGGRYRIVAGATADIYPFFHPAAGTLRIVPDFASPQLGNKRALRIYLPPSYGQNAQKRYPVLYMHDGQNLFDAKTAAYGVEWGIAKTMDRLIAAGSIDEAIVVGIDNTPDRIPEYTPCCDPKYGGGKLDAYERFIIDTVKPYVDAQLRTLPGRAHTAIMGSSLGGIASVYIAQRHPEVFAMAGGVSSSFWWNERAMIKATPAKLAVKFYIDAGTNNDGLEDTIAFRDALLAHGYVLGRDLDVVVADGASHNETSWAARVEKPLTWFFPFGATRD